MCMICAGASYDDYLAHHVRIIEKHGWAIIGVTGKLPWAYTVGLTWNLHHPELIVVGIHPGDIAEVLHRVVDEIEDGARLAPGSSLQLLGGELAFGRVDHRNLVGEWFAQWHPVARAAGHGTTSLRALQMRIAELDDCDASFDRQRALARRCTVDQLSPLAHPS